MNSADALIKTLIENGLEVVFANPGTSEMHLVAAIDHHPEIRPVLGLFEGVVTGAADGYARMSGKAAANLLHLGPGLGNGFANIHNAKKARTPMLNIVGDHATYHLQLGLRFPILLKAWPPRATGRYWASQRVCPGSGWLEMGLHAKVPLLQQVIIVALWSAW